MNLSNHSKTSSMHVVNTVISWYSVLVNIKLNYLQQSRIGHMVTCRFTFNEWL